MTAGERPRIPWRDLDGILLLDKPVGISSNAALQRARRLFRARKAGHTGSLDPLASGMLPLCFGEATKFSGHLLAADKSYEVTIRWGQRTDTADADGTIVESRGPETMSLALLEAALPALTGAIEQVPPMYSALKHEGQRLYDLARSGRDVERKARPVTIYSLEVASFDEARPVLRVHCSKGTYIRTLVEDLAEQLGTLGHVAALRRLSVAPFGSGPMATLAELEERLARDGEAALDRSLLPPDAGLAELPGLELEPEQAFYLQRGNAVEAGPAAGLAGPVRLYGPGAKFLGLGEATGEGRINPRRLVAHSDNRTGIGGDTGLD